MGCGRLRGDRWDSEFDHSIEMTYQSLFLGRSGVTVGSSGVTVGRSEVTVGRSEVTVGRTEDRLKISRENAEYICVLSIKKMLT